ncbi:MAG: hypothetical protein A3F11_04585 [Gammaproteobacteria bacterium RIFCSPHIGHO2_12_FULL_37_14]|nr:MAG: hypothetical protein A3F11_04585 [Gammaproteobacteria bacterium RIFCSPHIGHO2_12_FULL_37_14]
MVTFSLNKQQSLVGSCIIFSILILFFIIYSFKQWQSDWTLTHAQTSATPLLRTVNLEIENSLPNEHIFGQSSTGMMPITNLQLRVTGIVRIENDQEHTYSKAYISMAAQPSKIYQIGDTLGYGVKIYDITADAVILENDNHIEKLPLPREKLKFKSRNLREY